MILRGRKSKRNIFLITAFALAFIIVAGIFFIKPLANNQIIINSNNFDTEIKTVIESYIGYAVQNNWDKALNYLSGEAYIITKTNLTNYKGENLKLKSINVYNVATGTNFAIADVEVVSVSNANVTYNKYFRYYLYKDKEWKIISIDTPTKPIYSGKTNKYDFNSLIRNYFKALQDKQYNKVFELLTTPALENGQNNMINPDSINMSMNFSDIKTNIVYNSGNNVFVDVTYTAETTINNKITKKDMNYIFEIDNIDNSWHISDMKLVK